MTLRSLVLAFTLILQLPAGAQSGLTEPERTFNLTELFLGSAVQGSAPSIEFLADDIVALCRHVSNGSCLISVVKWDRDGVHGLGSMLAEHQGLIGRAGADHIFTTSLVFPTSSLYSIVSQTTQSIPFIRLDLASASGRLAGETTGTNWTLYTLVPTAGQLRQGTGTLLSVSDAKVAIRHGNIISTETLDGSAIGSFTVKPETKCFTNATLLNDALFLNTCGEHYIVSWSGKRLLKIHQPPGNPKRIATDESGTRLLLDYSTRNVSPVQSAAEVAVTVASLGAGAPEQFDNGEAVRVIDTKTGAVCFQWQTRLSRTDAFFSHASITPSGQFVAVAGPSALTVYRLPEKCSGR
jgi:hypothetical protein